MLADDLMVASEEAYKGRNLEWQLTMTLMGQIADFLVQLTPTGKDRDHWRLQPVNDYIRRLKELK
jgi:hypothetical protein